MNFRQRNQIFSSGEVDREDLWPKITEYEKRRFQFRWEFGLDELPTKPGILTIRGPRQVGKSTWLEIKLEETINEFGKGSAYFLNGDYIYSHDEFESALLELEAFFNPDTKIKRIFIDEVTQIKNWQRVVKRLIDSGHLKDILIITTGSNAADLLHGKERLPGRKGQLPLTEYLFLPISYREFCYTVQDELDELSSKDRFWSYVLTGGNPLAAEELYYKEMIADTFTSIVSDWIIGDLVSSGRSRQSLFGLLNKIYFFSPSSVSYTKLAKEAGLANNTTALDYIERLSDLLVLYPQSFYDVEKEVYLSRKASKFNFINLPAALIFHPKRPRYIHELKNFEGTEKGALFEWIVAQELWRQNILKLQKENKSSQDFFYMGYWKNQTHEIDFVLPNNIFYEVKAGKTNPFEFSWFLKLFPQKKLNVISDSKYKTEYIESIPFEEFLLSAPTDLYYDSDKELWMEHL